MRKFFVVILSVFTLGFSMPAKGESVMQVLEGIGEAANSLNQEASNFFEGRNSSSGNYAQAMARVRKLEAIRVHELAEAAGVDPEIIRKLRQNGETWEQIAATYNVDLASLPNPEDVLQGAGGGILPE